MFAAFRALVPPTHWGSSFRRATLFALPLSDFVDVPLLRTAEQIRSSEKPLFGDPVY